jgi:hypothetical protein
VPLSRPSQARSTTHVAPAEAGVDGLVDVDDVGVHIPPWVCRTSQGGSRCVGQHRQPQQTRHDWAPLTVRVVCERHVVVELVGPILCAHVFRAAGGGVVRGAGQGTSLDDEQAGLGLQ